MPSLQFLDTNKKPLLTGQTFYLWDASTLPSSTQFPSKTAPTLATCGKLDAAGNLQPFDGIQLKVLDANVSIPGCKAAPVKIAGQGFRAGLLRTYFQLPQQELEGVTTDDVEQVALSSANPQLIARMPPTPVVNLRFFVLSNVALPQGEKSWKDFINTRVSFLKILWTPPETGPTTKYRVTFQWDRTYRLIDDSANAYKRIDLLIPGSPQALSLVKAANWTNPHFSPDIPIFVCNAAWVQGLDPPPPHEGPAGGFTLTKSTSSWFKGERAILLFVVLREPNTLAHEMAHWVGFSHKESVALGNDNIGIAGGGRVVAPRQFEKLYRWATIRGFRRSIS